MRRHLLVVVALVSAAPTPALADEIAFMRVADDKPDEPLIPWETSFDVGFGMAMGATRIGDTGFSQVGVDILSRFRLGRAALQLGFQSVTAHRALGDGELLMGRSHRLTAAISIDVYEFGRGTVAGETSVALGTGRQFIGWDQGTLDRRDLSLRVEQAIAIHFPANSGKGFRGPQTIIMGFWLEIIASSTPPFAIVPVAATPPSGERNIGFLAGYGIRFRR